jgi:hypothetical protein
MGGKRYRISSDMPALVVIIDEYPELRDEAPTLPRPQLREPIQANSWA